MKSFGIVACVTSLVLGLPLLDRRTLHCHFCGSNQQTSQMDMTSNNNNNNNNNNIVIPLYGGGGGGSSSSSAAAGGGGYYPNYGGGNSSPGGVQVINQFESSPVQNGYSSANNMAGAGAAQGQGQMQGMGPYGGGGGGFPPLPPFFMDIPPGLGYDPMGGPLPMGPPPMDFMGPPMPAYGY